MKASKVLFDDRPKGIEVHDIGRGQSVVFFRTNIEEIETDSGISYVATEYMLELPTTENLEERINANKEAWLERVVANSLEAEKNDIRERRNTECFPIINRGKFWYDGLTEEKKAELLRWYHDWLDAPETLSVPTRPEWLA